MKLPNIIADPATAFDMVVLWAILVFVWVCIIVGIGAAVWTAFFAVRALLETI